jgi:hypothetical protein
LPLNPDIPGQYLATFDAPELGLYRLEEGGLNSVVAVGPAAPKEFEETVATEALLQPAVDAMRGGIQRISEGLPTLRAVREGRPAAGRGWIGITPREAYLTRDVSVMPLLPAWAVLLLVAAFAVGAWLIEGRRIKV